ncbi:MAG: nitroreductase family protein [Burkholderiaceae bacterium]|nr:nitroreductase family protein [Burkholderiaceae bacterium]
MLKSMLLGSVDWAVKPFPSVQHRLTDWKTNVKRWAKLKYFASDVVHAKRFMFWSERDSSYAKLSSELLFQFHKLEKGLCIPGKKRFFGRDPVIATCLLVKRWQERGFSMQDPVFIGAVETLRAYRTRLDETPANAEDAPLIHRLLSSCLSLTTEAPQFSTPQAHRRTEGAADVFDRLCRDRRSVRSYASIVVPLPLLHEAIATAQLSPSACNRQPWRVHVYRDAAQIKQMLALQNGNSGFGHLLSTLLVICADSRSFFDASERHEPYVDAGLFAMSLILALQARGLASCCLNWCVAPDVDAEAHARGELPEHEKVIMYLAVGYASPDALVPRSPRRDVGSMMTIHGA